jgi:putative oxidoreductase
MFVAIASVHWSRGFFAQKEGIELPLLYITAAFVLAFTGPGDYSLDFVLGLHARPSATTVWALLAAAMLLGLLNLAARRPRRMSCRAIGESR